jgi:predicted Zn finger-like uncharacterized protein
MRLVCPKCVAQYEVDDNAIPESGRDVQCASCGHTWFQDSIRMLSTRDDDPTNFSNPLSSNAGDTTAGAAQTPPGEDIFEDLDGVSDAPFQSQRARSDQAAEAAEDIKESDAENLGDISPEAGAGEDPPADVATENMPVIDPAGLTSQEKDTSLHGQEDLDEKDDPDAGTTKAGAAGREVDPAILDILRSEAAFSTAAGAGAPTQTPDADTPTEIDQFATPDKDPLPGTAPAGTPIDAKTETAVAGPEPQAESSPPPTVVSTSPDDDAELEEIRRRISGLEIPTNTEPAAAKFDPAIRPSETPQGSSQAQGINDTDSEPRAAASDRETAEPVPDIGQPEAEFTAEKTALERPPRQAFRALTPQGSSEGPMPDPFAGDVPSLSSLRAMRPRTNGNRDRLRATDILANNSTATGTAENTADLQLPRKNRLPDIDELASSLHPGDAQGPSGGRAAADMSDIDTPKRGRFRTGFLIAVLLVLLVFAIYVLKPQIISALPQAEPALNALTAFIDRGRLAAESLVASVLSLFIN